MAKESPAAATKTPLEESLPLLKALGSASRVAIVSHLLSVGEELSKRGIADHVGLTNTTVREHVKKLCRAGVLKESENGDNPLYGINDEVAGKLQAITDQFKNRHNVWNTR